VTEQGEWRRRLVVEECQHTARRINKLKKKRTVAKAIGVPSYDRAKVGVIRVEKVLSSVVV
jgi:hypothetical protein